MFKKSHIIGSFSVRDAEKAQKFYTETLGLKVDQVLEGFMEVTLPEGGKVWMYEKGNDHTPATFTVLYILVEDILKARDELRSHGVTFEHYEDYGLDADNVAKTPSNDKLAWIKDPSDNVVAIMESAEA